MSPSWLKCVVFCLALAVSLPAARAAQEPVGEDAPDFALRDLDNKEVSLKSLRGQVVVLQFWSTYWTGGHADMARLDRLSREFKGKGVAVFGVNVGQLPRVVRDFIKSKGYGYPQLVNARGELILAYRATDEPTVVIIGKDGKIIDYLREQQGEDRLRAALRKAVE